MRYERARNREGGKLSRVRELVAAFGRWCSSKPSTAVHLLIEAAPARGRQAAALLQSRDDELEDVLLFLAREAGWYRQRWGVDDRVGLALARIKRALVRLAHRGVMYEPTAGFRPRYGRAFVLDPAAGMPLRLDALKAAEVPRRTSGAHEPQLCQNAGEAGTDPQLRDGQSRVRKACREARLQGIPGRAGSPDAKRQVVERIYAAWIHRADWRLGQLLANGMLADDQETLYRIEDEALAAVVERAAR